MNKQATQPVIETPEYALREWDMAVAALFGERDAGDYEVWASLWFFDTGLMSPFEVADGL